MTVWTIRRYSVNICRWILLFLCPLVCANPALAERASLVFNPATAAVDACHRMRDRGYYCVAQNPETLRIRLKEGRLALKQAQDLGSF